MDHQIFFSYGQQLVRLFLNNGTILTEGVFLNKYPFILPTRRYRNGHHFEIALALSTILKKRDKAFKVDAEEVTSSVF